MRYALATVAAAVLATLTVAAQAPDRSRAPEPGAPPALKLPVIQKRQLSNGLPVWIVELHEVPVVQANLVVLSGSGDDPAGKFGVANLTASMLLEGAGSRSALELADAVDFLGADLVANSGSDVSAVRLHVPVARLADALPIMSDVALRPTFPADELQRQRADRLTNVIQARDDPETIGQLAFARVLYGTTHRYGTAQAGRGPDDSVVHRGRRPRVLHVGLPAGQRGVHRRRRRDGRARHAAARDEFRQLAAAGPGAAARRASGAAGAAGAAGVHHRQARCRAVADPHRLRWPSRDRRRISSRSR